MATLTARTVNGTSSRGSWVSYSGGTTNIHLFIDETIAAAVDTNDYIKANNDANNSDSTYNLTDMPADLGSISALSYDVRYALSATRSNDTYGLSVRIMSGATVMAANASDGTFQVVNSNITTPVAPTFTNKGSTAFAYVNTAGTKAQWDAATVTFRQTYSQATSKDASSVAVSAFEITGTYTVATSTASLDLVKIEFDYVLLPAQPIRFVNQSRKRASSY